MYKRGRSRRCEVIQRDWLVAPCWYTEFAKEKARIGDIDGAVQAGNAIERLTAVPVDPGFILHELPLLRMRALLAQAHGDEAGYRDFAERYRNMANALGFEGHVATAATMT